MRLTEISPGCDLVTAVFNSELESGESFDSPVCIGHYNGTDEIFIVQGELTLNIQNADITEFCKQLKRAAKIAKEHKELSA